MAAAQPYGGTAHCPVAFRLVVRIAVARIERVWHAPAPRTTGRVAVSTSQDRRWDVRETAALDARGGPSPVAVQTLLATA